MNTNKAHEWTRRGTRTNPPSQSLRRGRQRTNAKQKTDEPRMNTPSREAIESKLLIYADGEVNPEYPRKRAEKRKRAKPNGAA
jgi:hypothetical protein